MPNISFQAREFTFLLSKVNIDNNNSYHPYAVNLGGDPVVGRFVFALYQLAVKFKHWPILSIICGRYLYTCGLGVTRPLLITQVIQSKNKPAHYRICGYW